MRQFWYARAQMAQVYCRLPGASPCPAATILSGKRKSARQLPCRTLSLGNALSFVCLYQPRLEDPIMQVVKSVQPGRAVDLRPFGNERNWINATFGPETRAGTQIRGCIAKICRNACKCTCASGTGFFQKVVHCKFLIVLADYLFSLPPQSLHNFDIVSVTWQNRGGHWSGSCPFPDHFLTDAAARSGKYLQSYKLPFNYNYLP